MRRFRSDENASECAAERATVCMKRTTEARATQNIFQPANTRQQDPAGEVDTAVAAASLRHSQRHERRCAAAPAAVTTTAIGSQSDVEDKRTYRAELQYETETAGSQKFALDELGRRNPSP